MKFSKQPNIIMVTTDHQRADSIGMFQCGMEVTPNLNKLAKASSFFTRAYNTCPLCVPARTAMATGMYPTQNGVVLNKSQPCVGRQTMHQYLYHAGYEVAHIGVNHIRVSPHLKETLPFVKWKEVAEYKRFFAEKGKPGHDQLSLLGTFSKKVVEMREGSFVNASYSNSNTAVWFDEPADHFMDLYFCNEGVSFIKEQAERNKEEQPPCVVSQFVGTSSATCRSQTLFGFVSSGAA
jgi:arylsulfatase A-like enzyme